MKTQTLWLTVLLLLVSLPAYALDRISIGGRDGLDPHQPDEPYSILLALSGGGARGLATIGVLKAFEERGIRTAAIAGTSMGGIIGGLYATGYSATELENIVRGIDFSDLFSNRPSRNTMFQTQRLEEGKQLLLVRFDGFRPVIPRAITAGQKLTSILTRLTVRATYLSGGDFSRLPIPFKTVCTDMVSGDRIVMDHGSLADAMRATMAFPLAFTPLERDGRLLMDGGLVTPIPVDIVRGMSDRAQFVVAVNTVSPLLPLEKLTTPIDIANQATSIMTADRLDNALRQADLVVAPDIDRYQLSDFEWCDSLIAAGYRAGLAAADNIVASLDHRLQYDTLAVLGVVGTDAPPQVTDRLADELSAGVFSREELVRRLKAATLACDLFSLDVSMHDVVSQRTGYRTVVLDLSARPNLRLSEAVFRFEGNRLFDDSVLATHLPTEDSLITSEWIRTAVDSLLAFYREHSCDLTAVRDVDIDRATRTVSFTIDEAIIERVIVSGNRRTRGWFVRSLFPLKVGQPYSSARAAKGIANIYGANLFDRVTIDLTPTDSGAIVTIGLEEKHTTQLRVGWHWHDEYASEEYLELRDPNINGMGLEYTAHAQYGEERQVYAASLKLDRIRSTYLTGRIEAYHTLLDRRVYDAGAEYLHDRRETKSGGEIRVGQQIARFGTVSAALIAEQVAIRTQGVDEEKRFGLRILKLESLVEDFDRVPFTESGKRHLFELQFAGRFLGGEAEFTRFYTAIEAYVPLGRDVNWHPKGALGFSRSGLPVTEKFYLGDQDSFYGYRTSQLAGDKVALISNELRFRLPLHLYLSVRHDMGDVYGSTDQIKLRNLKHAIGVSLALDSPLGPIEAGYGVVESSRDRFYVNVGHRF